MANTFLLAAGYKLGKSLVEADLTDTAKDILAAAQKSGCTIFLPEDANVAEAIDGGDQSYIVTVDTVPDTHMILDYGPLAMESLLERMKSVKTVVWNGPMGLFEIPPFDTGTLAVAKAMIESTDAGGITVVGGGDTAAAVNDLGLASGFSHVSTGGGASLRMLEGGPMPGVEALDPR
mgnify:CR=1 FL=1